MKTTSGLAIVSALIILFACQSKPVSDASAIDAIDIMSFNIRYGTADDGENRWENRRHLVFQVIQEHQPDIVGLQEALHFQINEILTELPAYDYIGVGRADGDTAGEYTAILYDTSRFSVDTRDTFWFSNTPETVASTDWGNDIPRICTWGYFVDNAVDAGFYVYNVHLDHRSQSSRAKSVQLLAERINNREREAPFVITGDFNAAEDNPAIYFLNGIPTPDINISSDIPVRDAFRIARPEAAQTGTFNGFEGDRSGNKIDYIFVQPDVSVLDASIITDNDNGRYPSDHFPVSATIKF